MPTISKIIERHIANTVFQYLNENNLIRKEQSGFRGLHSCHTALTKLTETWLNEMNLGNLTGIVYLDFSKAFDLVNHSILLTKLQCYKFHPNAIQWISSYLGDRTQKVVIGNDTSDQKSIPRGVPQGSVLGPLLFLIFINDLPLAVQNSNIDLFADDTTLHKSGATISHIETRLNNDLTKVEEWCHKNDMFINADKTKTMVVTTSQKYARLPSNEIVLEVNNTKIENIKSHKLLGVHVDNHLQWDVQINETVKRINTKLNLINRIKRYLSTNTRLLYFNAYVLPLFDYCVTIWGNCSQRNNQIMIRLQKKAARIILGKDMPSRQLFKDLGWLDFINRVKFQKCILIYKTLNGLSPQYMNEILQQNNNASTYQLRSASNRNLQLPKPNLEIFKKSLQFSGIEIWNSLPSELKLCKNLQNFKEKCHIFFLQKQMSVPQ